MDYSSQTEVTLQVTHIISHWSTDRPKRRDLIHALRSAIEDMKQGRISAFKIVLPSGATIEDAEDAKRTYVALKSS